ncbi:MAG: hypothetical protein IJS88_02590 [Alphaproteobacteria bacterium]|nr:hypothetical protein [Alphaproteobacteria bacterium]
MIAYTVLLLFFIGIFSSVKVGVKVDKVLAFVTFASLFFVFVNFCDGMLDATEHSFSFIWNTSQGRNLKFDILSNVYNYALVLPCFLITLLSCFNNLLFRNEERKSAYSSLLIFNLVALIVLITSNNFVQLVSALFIVDILSLFMIKDIQASQRYVLLNMAADMMLFSVLALINARVDSLDIKEILRYRQIGFHEDYVALTGLTAIFAKLGFAVFQIGNIALKDIRFHRMQNVLLLSSPMAALILLLKLNMLWRFSDYFNIYADSICYVTLIWAFVGSIVVNDFQTKIIYWQMSFWALMVALLRFYGFIWIPEFTYLLTEMYVFINALFLLYYYNNRCHTVSEMMKLRLIHKKRLASVALIVLLTITAGANTLLQMYNQTNRMCIWLFTILFLISTAATLGQIYFYKGKRLRGVQHDIKFKWTVWVELLCLCGVLLYGGKVQNVMVWVIPIIFVFLWFCPLLRSTAYFYKLRFLQKSDLLGDIYLSVIKSFRLCGRVFWLLIDHLFLDKLVMELAVVLSHICLRMFRKLHSKPIFGGMIVLLLLVGMLWYSYRAGEING